MGRMKKEKRHSIRSFFGQVGPFGQVGQTAYSLLNSVAIKKVCFQRDPKGSILFENRPEIQITRISTRGAAPVSAAGAEPVYDAWAPVSAAGAAEAVSRAPVSELLSAGEPVWPEPVLRVQLSAGEPVWLQPVSRVPLSAGEPVGPVQVSLPDHTADSVSGSDLAVAAERRARLRH